MLGWLDADRDAAARKHETIRAGLIRIFVSQGFSDAEHLADLTINVVINKLPEIRGGYVGEPAYYFNAVARNIAREARRAKEVATDKIPERPGLTTDTSDSYDCLLGCLKVLPEGKRELILDYYLYEGRDKVEHHRRLAAELGITEGALRMRVFHIKSGLEKCVSDCVRRLDEKQKLTRSALSNRRPASSLSSEERQL